jgi:predicted nuclease with TOPRIM domain
VIASRQTLTETVERTSAGDKLDELQFEIRELKTGFNAIRVELVQLRGEMILRLNDQQQRQREMIDNLTSVFQNRIDHLSETLITNVATTVQQLEQKHFDVDQNEQLSRRRME